MDNKPDHPNVRGNNNPALGGSDSIFGPRNFALEPSNNYSIAIIPNLTNYNITSTQNMCRDLVPRRPYFSFLSLPTEVRLMVYQALWVLPMNRDLTTALSSLTLTCHTIRNEVVDEFINRIFPVTMMHLGTSRQVLKGLRLPLPIIQNLQHVTLFWGRCYCDWPLEDTREWGYKKNLKWLAKLEQLKTLELVFTDGHYFSMLDLTNNGTEMPALPAEPLPDEDEVPSPDLYADWHYQVMVEWFCEECWELLLKLPRTLEKVWFRVWTKEQDQQDTYSPPTVEEKWEVTQWWYRMRFYEKFFNREGEEEGGAQEYVEDLPEQHTHQIKYHVGDVDPDWRPWPLSDTA